MAVSKGSLKIQSSVVNIKNKLKQNGSNATIKDGAKTNREKVSQRLGISTRTARSDTMAMEEYIRW